MSTRDLAQKMTSSSTNNSEIYVIQKYIKSKGPNAYIVRGHYRKSRPPESFVITNKTSFFDPSLDLEESDKYITNMKKPLSCSIVHARGGKISEEGAC